MKKDFVPKYKYFTNNKDTVVAVCRYAERNVRGIAKCSPDDTFDFEKGKALAKARCDLKVAGQRYRHLANAKKDAGRILDYWDAYYDKINTNYHFAVDQLKEAENNYQKVLESL